MKSILTLSLANDLDENSLIYKDILYRDIFGEIIKQIKYIEKNSCIIGLSEYLDCCFFICPFCGNLEENLYEYANLYTQDTNTGIMCNKCNACFILCFKIDYILDDIKPVCECIEKIDYVDDIEQKFYNKSYFLYRAYLIKNKETNNIKFDEISYVKYKGYCENCKTHYEEYLDGD